MQTAESELVSHANNFAPQIAEFVQGIDALADPVTRRDYFESMDEDGFVAFTQQIAGLIRTGDSNNLQQYDGAKAQMEVDEVPDQRDKEDLLRETWRTARAFLTDRRFNDTDVLEYAALTIAGGLIYTHPFADGNGRTSRVASFIIATGGNDQAALKQMLSDSFKKGWEITPNYKITEARQQVHTSAQQPQRIAWRSSALSNKDAALVEEITSSVHRDEVLRSFIDSVDDKTAALIKACSTEDAEATIDGDKLLELLVNDPETGITNASHLLELQYKLRAERVRDYLRAMRDDTPVELRVVNRGDLEDHEGMSGQRRIRAAKIGAVVAERSVNGKMPLHDQAVALHRGLSSVRKDN